MWNSLLAATPAPLAPRAAMASAGWWIAVVALPSAMAKRTMRRGRIALDAGQYDLAERCFRKAAAHLGSRTEATCLVAEALIRQGKAQEAISALDPLFPANAEPDTAAPPRRGNFLLSVAYGMLRRGSAAQGEIGPIVFDPTASGEEKLAAAQACLLARDMGTAKKLLEGMDTSQFAGKLLARAKICQAAVFWHEGRWRQSMETLPPIDQCEESDQFVVHSVRQMLATRIAAETGRRASG